MSNLDIVQGYRVPIAKKYGINVAIVYEKVQFWADRGKRGDGWVYKTYADMEDETALSTKQIGLAYKKLCESGVIETKVMKVGKTPTLHFRLIQKAKSIEIAKRQSPINTEKTTENNNTHDSSNSSDISFGGEKEIKKEKEAAHDGTHANCRDCGTNPRTDHLNELIQIVNPREKATQERIRMLNARRKDYSFDEIRAAAQAFSKSEWHKENKQMSIDNLLAPSKFGRWYQAGQEGGGENIVTSDGKVWTPEMREKLLREQRGY